jgi:hypothetical protein
MATPLPTLISDPLLAAFIDRRGIAQHIDAALGLAVAAFGSNAEITLQLKRDPELEGVEYVKVRVVAIGSVPEVSAAYRKLTSELVANVPFEARQYMRISVTFVK